MREENIRRAGWAGVIACSLVGLFEFLWINHRDWQPCLAWSSL